MSSRESFEYMDVAYLTAQLTNLIEILDVKMALPDKLSSQPIGDPVFPTEITDMIIDYLHESPYMLKWCSLVCRSWTASTRYHLFYTISFSPEKAAFNQLLAFLLSAPDACAYIKVFTLSGYRGISLRDLHAVLEPLTSLRSLTLDQLYISNPRRHEPVIKLALGPLDNLRISSCNVVETDIFLLLSLLGLFSKATSLHLSHSHSSYSIRRYHFGALTPYSRTSSQFPLHFRVEHLVLRALPVTVLDLIFNREYLPHRWVSLRTLCLDGGCSSWEHVRTIGEFLTIVGPQLREIAVRPPYMLLARDELLANGLPPATTRDTTEDWRALHLDKCTKLEVFKISVGHEDHFARRDSKSVFRTTVDLLAHLPATVTQVRVGFSPDRFSLHGNRFEQYKDFLMGLDWQALDHTLSSRRFKTLKVVLDVGPVKETFDMKQCKELFGCARNALPRLDSGNVLELDFTAEKWWVHDFWD